MIRLLGDTNHAMPLWIAAPCFVLLVVWLGWNGWRAHRAKARARRARGGR